MFIEAVRLVRKKEAFSPYVKFQRFYHSQLASSGTAEVLWLEGSSLKTLGRRTDEAVSCIWNQLLPFVKICCRPVADNLQALCMEGTGGCTCSSFILTGGKVGYCHSSYREVQIRICWAQTRPLTNTWCLEMFSYNIQISLLCISKFTWGWQCHIVGNPIAWRNNIP